MTERSEWQIPAAMIRTSSSPVPGGSSSSSSMRSGRVSAYGAGRSDRIEDGGPDLHRRLLWVMRGRPGAQLRAGTGGRRGGPSATGAVAPSAAEIAAASSSTAGEVRSASCLREAVARAGDRQRGGDARGVEDRHREAAHAGDAVVDVGEAAGRPDAGELRLDPRPVEPLLLGGVEHRRGVRLGEVGEDRLPRQPDVERLPVADLHDPAHRVEPVDDRDADRCCRRGRRG